MDVRSEEQQERAERLVSAFVLRLRSGDAAGAWMLFVGTYAANLQKVIRRFAADEESRSDCFVFVCEHLRAQDCRRLSRFEQDGSARFTTWLYAVVYNLCLDWKRHQRPRLQLVPLDEADIDRLSMQAGNPPARDPANLAEEQIDRIRLARALDRLPAEDRLLVRLRYEKELTLAELVGIASLRNAQAVDRRLRSIIGRLQREFESTAAETAPAHPYHPSETRGR